jgi:hypothetical protein
VRKGGGLHSTLLSHAHAHPPKGTSGLTGRGAFLVVTCTLGSGTRLVSERAAAVTACSFLPWSIGNVGGRWTLHVMMLGRVNDTPITNPAMKAISIRIMMVSISIASLSHLARMLKYKLLLHAAKQDMP